MVGRELRDAAGMLSSIGRALPIGGDKACAKSLKEHKKNLLSGGTTPKTELLEVRAWMARVAGRNPYDVLAALGDSTISNSACLTTSRSKGGNIAELVSALETAPPLDPPGVSLPELEETAVVDARLRDHFLPLLGLIPQAKVEVVRERGGKVRVVTKSPAGLVLLGHRVRQAAYRILKRHPASSHVLEGKDEHGVLTLLGPTRGLAGKALSADFSSATDLIHQDFALAIVDGLCEGLGVYGSEFHNIARLMVGPQEVTWPDGTKAVSNRGILMGLPLTWVLLSLAQIYWAERGTHEGRIRAGLPIRLSVPQPWIQCGDDLFAIWIQEVRDAYEERCRLAGMQFSSASKHFYSRDRGVFLEVLWKLRKCGTLRIRPDSSSLASRFPAKYWRKESLMSVHRTVGTFALRGLVRPCEEIMGPNGKFDESLPSWWAIGPAAQSLVDRGADPRRVWVALRAASPGTIQRLRKMGFYPYLSRKLGGGGVPHPLGSNVRLGKVAPRRWRKAIASLMTDLSPSARPGQLESCWATARPGNQRALAADMVEGDFSHSYRVRDKRIGLQPGEVWTGLSASDAEELMVGDYCRRLTFMIGPEPPGEFGWVKSIHNLLKRRITELEGRWKSAKPTKLRMREVLDRLDTVLENLEAVAFPVEDPARPGHTVLPHRGWSNTTMLRAQVRIASGLGWRRFFVPEDRTAPRHLSGLTT